MSGSVSVAAKRAILTLLALSMLVRPERVQARGHQIDGAADGSKPSPFLKMAGRILKRIRGFRSKRPIFFFYILSWRHSQIVRCLVMTSVLTVSTSHRSTLTLFIQSETTTNKQIIIFPPSNVGGPSGPPSPPA